MLQTLTVYNSNGYKHHYLLTYLITLVGWWRGSVDRMLVFGWRTFPDLCLVMIDMWPLRGQGVRYGSTNQANSTFHPFGVSKWVVTHVITWITGVETIKRQTTAACGCMAARLCVQPLLTAYRLHVRPCLWRATAVAFAACGVLQVLCLHLYLLQFQIICAVGQRTMSETCVICRQQMTGLAEWLKSLHWKQDTTVWQQQQIDMSYTEDIWHADIPTFNKSGLLRSAETSCVPCRLCRARVGLRGHVSHTTLDDAVRCLRPAFAALATSSSQSHETLLCRPETRISWQLAAQNSPRHTLEASMILSPSVPASSTQIPRSLLCVSPVLYHCWQFLLHSLHFNDNSIN